MLFHYKKQSYSLLSALWLLSVAVSMNSCKKLVDVGEPVNTITTEQVFTSDAHANSAIAALYSQLMTNNGSMVFSNGDLTIYAGLSSDELVNSSGTNNTMDYQFFTNTLYAYNTVVYGNLWQPAYKVIYGANDAIAGIAASTASALDDSTRTELTGEAKFIRAFCYFYLTGLFGDVPMPLVTDFNQTALMSRTPQADVYKQIVQDLKDAQSTLPADYSVGLGERIRANKWAATALLARVYLYQQDWADAETQADSVIGNSQFGLTASLGNVFLMNSTETILQWKPNNTVSPYNATWEGTKFIPPFRWSTFDPITQATLLAFPSFYALDASQLIPAYYLSTPYMTAFEPGDKRKKIWTDSVATPSAAPYNGVPYFFPVKYTVNPGLSGGAVTQYYMVLRLAEQYLIRAEARAQQGTNLSGAASDLNMLRSRAGLAGTTAATQADLLTAVAHERQVELFAEWGHRWLDLKRTGQANTVLGALASKQPWSGNALLYPIPASDIISDPNLIQNPGY